MNSKRKILAAMLLAAPALLYIGCSSAARGEPLHGPLDVSNSHVARGQVVFMNKCEKCHPGGDAGLGPALNNKPLPGFLVKYQSRHGMGAMPAFGKNELPQPDLNDVVSYLKALRRNG